MKRQISRRTILSAGAAITGGLLLGVHVGAADAAKKRVVCWSEGTATQEKAYPRDINAVVAEGLKADLEGWDIVVANLSDPDQGINDERLNSTDVLIWWGHKKHGDVKDALVKKIVKRVTEDGMGFIALHSSHFAKPNIALMSQKPTKPEILAKVQPKNRVAAWGAYLGDSLELKIIVKDPKHPIAEGITDFTIPHHERYNNPYAVPTPDSLVFDGVYTNKDGSTSPSEQGFVWTIGKGKVFYFQPGHETDPVFFHPTIRKIMKNAVLWAAK